MMSESTHTFTQHEVNTLTHFRVFGFVFFLFGWGMIGNVVGVISIQPDKMQVNLNIQEHEHSHLTSNV